MKMWLLILATTLLAIILTSVIYNSVNKNNKKKDVKIALDNGLEVLAIQDKSLTNTSIYLRVDVGSIYDPKEATGLAHLLEHMICIRSTKYPVKNELINLKNEKSGFVTVYTIKDRMEFTLKISDVHIHKAADMLAWALYSPLFDEEDIKSEVKIIDQEFKSYLKNDSHIRNRFVELATEPSFPEHQLFCGNSNTLSGDNIQQLLKNLHSKHFTPDRMKLVIASKKPVKEIKKIAELFNILPKRASKELSLNKKSANVKYSDSFAGKIVRYESNSNTMKIIMNVPSTLQSFQYREVEYFLGILDKFKRSLKNDEMRDFVSNFSFIQECRERLTYFFIEFHLSKAGMSNINEILQKFYSFIHSQAPNVYDFELVKSSILSELKVSKPVEEMIMGKVIAFFSSPIDSLEVFKTQCEFNEAALLNMLDSVGNIKNWLVLVPTNENDLPNSDEHFIFKYSNPESIKVSVNFTLNPEKKIELRKESKLDLDPEFHKSIESELKSLKARSVIHKEFLNGQYSLLFDRSFGEMCEVKIKFFSKMNQSQCVNSLIFWHLLLKNIQNRSLEFKVNLVLDYDNMSNHRSITFKGKRQEILYSIDWIMNVIRNFKPNNEEILSAKTQLKEIIQNTSGSTAPYYTLLTAFMNYASGYPSAFDYHDLIENAACEFYPDYYISIQSLGIITESENRVIYELTKSTGTIKPDEYVDLETKRYSYTTFDTVNQGFMTCYNINIPTDGEVSNLQNFAIGFVLKNIISSKFFNFLRSQHSIAYMAEVESFIYCSKEFLGFFIQSTLSETDIKSYQEKFSATIPGLVQAISDDEFSQIKNSACKQFDVDLSKKENLPTLQLFMSSFCYYDLSIFDHIKKEIKKISKEDLMRSLSIFEQEPITLIAQKRD